MNDLDYGSTARRDGVYRRFTPLDVEQYRLGELDPQRRAWMDSELSRDPDLAGELSTELARLESLDRDFLAARPAFRNFTLARPETGGRTTGGKGSRIISLTSRWTGIAALAVLGVGLLVLRQTNQDQPGLANEDGVRYKGNQTLAPADSQAMGTVPGLQVYLNHGDRAEQLSPGSMVSENDSIQIAYTNPGFRYGVIFSVDGNRRITLHYPLASQDSPRLEGPGTVLLPFAYRLDNAPSYENFYFIATNQLLDPEELMKAIQALVDQGTWDNQENRLARFLPGGIWRLSAFPLRKQP